MPHQSHSPPHSVSQPDTVFPSRGCPEEAHRPGQPKPRKGPVSQSWRLRSAMQGDFSWGLPAGLVDGCLLPAPSLFPSVSLCPVHAQVASVVSTSLRPRGLQPARLHLPMGFSRQGYWSGLPFPPPGDLPHPGIEAAFLTSPALAPLPLAPLGKPCVLSPPKIRTQFTLDESPPSTLTLT